jgi:hypothetical protein
MTALRLLPQLTASAEGVGRDIIVRPTDRNHRWTRAFGGMFVLGGLAHLLLLSLNSSAYDSFADNSYWPFITHTWHSVLVPHVVLLHPAIGGLRDRRRRGDPGTPLSPVGHHGSCGVQRRAGAVRLGILRVEYTGSPALGHLRLARASPPVRR